jgi:hypothetical protein
MFELGIEKYRELQVLAACPSPYTPPLFFTRYRRAFIPPYFADTAEEISQKTRVNFTQLWGWECERLMKSLAIPEEIGDTSSYTGGPGRKGNLVGASSRVAEAFKSGFLRCVAWFHLQGLLSKEDFVEYSMKVCPIDLSLWDIRTAAPPDWWPRSDLQAKEVSTLSEWDQCSNLPDLTVKGRRQMLAAEGAVIPATQEIRSYFSLLPFAYSIRDRVGDVCAKIHRELKTSLWMKSPISEHPITIFDGPDLDRWVPLYDRSETIAGVELHPLVAGVRLLHINTWQYWRGMHPPFFPTLHLLVKGGTASHDAEGWFYETAGHRLFEGYDWRIGSLERTHDNEYELTGQYALCDPDWLNGYLEQAGLRLAHVLRVSVFQRKREYEDATETHNCRLLNLGTVVT